MITNERVKEIDEILRSLAGWASRRSDVRGLVLVGSSPRGAPRSDSYVDLVLLTDSPSHYTTSDARLADTGGVRMVRTLKWGVITERRFALPSGLEVELDVGTPDWTCANPLDTGTRKVVADGMRILYDPDGLLANLVSACSDASLKQDAS